MREILFRGQTRRKGEKVWMDGTPVESNWVYGGIFPGTGDFSVIYTFDPIAKCPVYSDTVGQFTGLTDKNGKRIFEGDIITAKDDVFGSPFCNGITGKIIYDEAAFFIMPKDPMETQWLFNECAVYEVIGNIHDNPELLEVSDNGNL